MEKQSKEHIQEVNRIHSHYQEYVTRSQELAEKCNSLQRDAETAIQSERQARREVKRLQMQNDSLIKRLSGAERKNLTDTHKLPGGRFVTQIQDLISDSNKDFIIGSSSVVINESDHGANSVHALSNPLSSSQHWGELPPPIVSGQCDAPDLEEMYSIRNQSEPMNPTRANKNVSGK